MGRINWFAITMAMLTTLLAVMILIALSLAILDTTPLFTNKDYDMTIIICGNDTVTTRGYVTDSINKWNNISNAKFRMSDTNSGDVYIYFSNASIAGNYKDGMFKGASRNPNVLGSTNYQIFSEEANIWINDANDITEDEREHVVLHEMCHAMGIPHLSQFGGVMGVALHDPLMNSGDGEFTSEEIAYIQEMYP